MTGAEDADPEDLPIRLRLIPHDDQLIVFEFHMPSRSLKGRWSITYRPITEDARRRFRELESTIRASQQSPFDIALLASDVLQSISADGLAITPQIWWLDRVLAHCPEAIHYGLIRAVRRIGL